MAKISSVESAICFVIADKLLDLRMFVLALVERNPDLVVRCGHGAAEKARRLALDIEIADLAEIEDALIIFGPDIHLPALQVVREVIERVEADAVGLGHGAFDRLEIDIIDGRCTRPVDQIEVRPANALDRRDVELHRPDLAGYRRSAALDGKLQRLVRIGNPERHGIGRRPAFFAELRGLAVRLHVEDEIDVALRIAADVFAAMIADMGETHPGEQIGQRIGIGAGEFDKFKAIKAHKVFGFLGHVTIPVNAIEGSIRQPFPGVCPLAQGWRAAMRAQASSRASG